MNSLTATVMEVRVQAAAASLAFPAFRRLDIGGRLRERRLVL